MTRFIFKIDESLPSLVIPVPTCGHCDRDVHIEDGIAVCDHCLIQWDVIADGAEAEPDPNVEGTDVPCLTPSTQEQTAPYNHNGRHYELSPYEPCILPSGHEGEHQHPYEVTTTPLAEDGAA